MQAALLKTQFGKLSSVIYSSTLLNQLVDDGLKSFSYLPLVNIKFHLLLTQTPVL